MNYGTDIKYSKLYWNWKIARKTLRESKRFWKTSIPKLKLSKLAPFGGGGNLNNEEATHITRHTVKFNYYQRKLSHALRKIAFNRLSINFIYICCTRSSNPIQTHGSLGASLVKLKTQTIEKIKQFSFTKDFFFQEREKAFNSGIFLFYPLSPFELCHQLKSNNYELILRKFKNWIEKKNNMHMYINEHSTLFWPHLSFSFYTTIR